MASVARGAQPHADGRVVGEPRKATGLPGPSMRSRSRRYCGSVGSTAPPNATPPIVLDRRVGHAHDHGGQSRLLHIQHCGVAEAHRVLDWEEPPNTWAEQPSKPAEAYPDAIPALRIAV